VPTTVGIKPKWTSDRHESVGFRRRKKTMIEEHDRVVLTEPLPERDLQAGDVGTVVHVYENGTAYEVEFFRLDGRTVAVETLSASAVRPVASTDVPHARTRE
jgi:hypothetical protein